jgi:hypothetical protein
MVITNQIENTKDWKHIGSDIGSAMAWVMKSANTRDMTCDEDDQFTYWILTIQIWQLLMMATTTNSKLLDKSSASNLGKGNGHD